MRITNSTFRRNTATLINTRGGAIYHAFGTLYVIGSTLSDSESFGIGINGASGSTTTNIIDSTISGNTFGGIETEDGCLVYSYHVAHAGDKGQTEVLVDAGKRLIDDPQDTDAKVDYNSFPPSSGPHYQSPAPWGIYEDPVKQLQNVA